MIDAKLVEDGRIQIPDMDWITGYVPAVFVGFSIGDTSLDPTSAIQIERLSRGGLFPLPSCPVFLLVDGPTKLSAPDYQCFIQ